MNEFDDTADGAEGVELPEAPLGDDLDVGGGGGGSKLPMIITIIVILIIQGVSSHFLVRQLFFSKPRQAKVEKKDTGAKKGAPGEIFNLSGLIINPKGSRGSKILMLELGLEASETGVIENLGKIEPILRDNITTFMGSQKPEVLTDIEWRERVRKRIKEIVNYNLPEGQIDNVYFIRYVFQ
ncbi:hypothetical protein GF324_02455 [bacterium]|nr:hypothetical protein [bacterium]